MKHHHTTQIYRIWLPRSSYLRGAYGGGAHLSGVMVLQMINVIRRLRLCGSVGTRRQRPRQGLDDTYTRPPSSSHSSLPNHCYHTRHFGFAKTLHCLQSDHLLLDRFSCSFLAVASLPPSAQNHPARPATSRNLHYHCNTPRPINLHLLAVVAIASQKNSSELTTVLRPIHLPYDTSYIYTFAERTSSLVNRHSFLRHHPARPASHPTVSRSVARYSFL